MDKIRAAVLGGTGLVGQRFIQLLDNHPYIEVVAITGFNSAGSRYGEAVSWTIEGDIPSWATDIIITRPEPDVLKKEGVELAFSALPSSVALDIEVNLVKNGIIVASNASPLRMEPDIPLLNGEVNHDHVVLVREQAKRGWKGVLLKNPNCSTAILTLFLKPLLDAYGIDKVLVTTLQAISGAGLRGLPAMFMVDNLIPYIAKEEWKIENESKKILGKLNNGKIEDLEIDITSTTTRVPVIDGHTEVVYIKLANNHDHDIDDVVDTLSSYKSFPQEANLPTAPEAPIIVRKEEDRPQPRLDRLAGNGMSIVVGRLKIYNKNSDTWLRAVILGHNTIRGAAGAAILAYEIYKKYIDMGLIG